MQSAILSAAATFQLQHATFERGGSGGGEIATRKTNFNKYEQLKYGCQFSIHLDSRKYGKYLCILNANTMIAYQGHCNDLQKENVDYLSD